MRNIRIPFFLLLSVVFLALCFPRAFAAPVPSTARLTVTLKYKDNLNLLRNKGIGYKVQKDGYATTLWAEGPYAPGTPCQITGRERQGIKMARVITFMENGLNRLGDSVVPNSWMYTDYQTPDFTAALIVSGMHYHCAYLTAEHGQCTTAVLSPTNSQRKDPATGLVPCGPASVLRSNAFPWCPNIADITAIPDGVSGATVYPDSQVSYTWDMRDTAGNLIQEGYYLVYAQFSAERGPRTMEGDTLRNGIAVVNLETCWDSPYFDTLGHHRVVNLFHFKDSAFTKADSNERHWRGDPYHYLNGPVVFSYSLSGGAAERGGDQAGGWRLEISPNPFRGFIHIRLGRPAGGISAEGLSVFGIKGDLIRDFPLVSGDRLLWDARDRCGQKVPPGLYFFRLKTTAGSIIRPVVLK